MAGHYTYDQADVGSTRGRVAIEWLVLGLLLYT